MKNDDDDADGEHVPHHCPAGARHSVELLRKRKTIVACGRRVGAHLSSPMAEGLERVKEGWRGLERTELFHVCIVANGATGQTRHPQDGHMHGGL